MMVLRCCFLRGFSDCARAYRSWITFTSTLYRNHPTRIRRASSLGGHRRNLQRTSSLPSMRSCKPNCELGRDNKPPRSGCAVPVPVSKQISSNRLQYEVSVEPDVPHMITTYILE